MPALVPTDYYGTITWLGFVASRKANLRSAPLTEMPLSFAGYADEDHAGLTRAACVRVKDQYARDTEIRNVRQLSVLSEEEIDATAKAMGLDSLDPQLFGASFVISGIPDFTHVPPNARLQGENGATITVDMENKPCSWVAREVEADATGKGALFKNAAKSRRGVTAWVEREGTFHLGEKLRLHVPAQRAWAP